MGTEERQCEECGGVSNWSHNGLQCIDPLHYSILRREQLLVARAEIEKLSAGRDVLLARIVEVEREVAGLRDQMSSMEDEARLTSVNLNDALLEGDMFRRERDEAMRVAKRLALCPRRNVDSSFEDWIAFDALVSTALAYKVDP